MKPKTAFWASLSGTVVVALCCFTPILVLLLGAVGLSVWVGYLDYVLLPALGVLLGLTLWSY
ncbi:MAG: mercury resistance system transport protein MerF [Leptolyngbya sp. SIO1E4]|nr:mercury resistance system transport protein MerF [Leptolyngbya sp. SIO1E4]